MPVYNGQEYLAESIESVLNQTYKTLELLIIDDVSSDGSIEIINTYRKDDSRIRLIQNDNNNGLVENWNKCLKEAKGTFLKFHFQDDLMEKESIEKMVDYLIESNRKLIISDRHYFFGKDDYSVRKADYFSKLPRLSKTLSSKCIISPRQMTDMMIENQLRNNFIGEPIVGLFDREYIISKYGNFDNRFSQIVDFEYWLRIATNESIAFIPEKLQKFRVHGQSQSSKNSRRKGMSKSHRDRILLTIDLLNSDHYANLRQLIGIEKMNDFARRVITHYVIRSGYRTTKRELGKEALIFFGQNRLDYIKAWINDYIKLF